MPSLVIVESPKKAGTIKSYLGSGYKVMASVGHVRDLPKSTLGVEIENDFRARYINIRGKGPLIADLKKEARAADRVYLATDPDREGEAISWHLATVLDIPIENTKRVTFNEITKNVVKTAIKNPRSIDMKLVDSQQARRILDRIVGYKLSPFLWKTVRSGLSAGRVQSVATKVLVDRENEIRAFVPVEYWTIDCILQKASGEAFKAKFYGDSNGKIELATEQDAAKVLSAVKGDGEKFVVSSIKKSKRTKNPAPPFTTSTLQQEASRRLGFQSTRIMKIAQELYEGVNVGSEFGGTQGLITYMRTDSLRVSDEAASDAKDYITQKFGESYYPPSPRIYKTTSKNAQDAHEAIRPSKPSLEPDKIKKSLSADQYKLYKLIWSRFTASQMASAVLDTVTADISCGGYIFRSSGYTVSFNGYTAVYNEAEDPDNAALPPLSEGEILRAQKIEPNQHFTEPPPRYTEATLVKFLEERGIGRPSTFATIISTILARGYVEREGKALKPTPLGEVTTKLITEYFPDIVNEEFTAKMEDNLDDIAHGETTVSGVLHGFYRDFEQSLEKAETNVGRGEIEVPVEETDIICDKCGRTMIIKNSRYGKFAACPGYPECKNTKPLRREGEGDGKAESETTDLKCELCGAPMLKKNGRFGAFYACSTYPTCKGTKQIMRDTGLLCPVCGGKILTKHGKKSVFYSCENYEKCGFSSWDLPLDQKCPLCSEILFRKKGKDLIICHNKACGYKAEYKKEDAEDENDE